MGERVLSIQSMKEPRILTHDEKKAAEAAFYGRPFHSSWSKSARRVYEGILTARGLTESSIDTSLSSSEHQVLEESTLENTKKDSDLDSAKFAETDILGSAIRTTSQNISSRQKAIEAGLLIDVSSRAKEVGLNLTVDFTKSLWNWSMTDAHGIILSDWEKRVRDMLVAACLRLASLDSPSSWVRIPVLLPSSDGSYSSRIFPIYAVFHHDPVEGVCLTLVHPKELSAIRSASDPVDEDELPNIL